jgi:hypothetical protein
MLSIRREHAMHDLGVDLVGIVRHARGLVEVARPLVRAHAHHRPLDLVVIASVALADVRLAHRVPHLLGLDQHTVHVEDDRVDHSA